MEGLLDKCGGVSSGPVFATFVACFLAIMRLTAAICIHFAGCFLFPGMPDATIGVRIDEVDSTLFSFLEPPNERAGSVLYFISLIYLS